VFRFRLIDDNDSAISDTYDVLSRLTQTTQIYGSAVSLAYTYDVVNRRTKMKDMVGDTIYGYDELNRLVSLTDPAGRSFSFGFDAGRRAISVGLANGVNAAMSYDGADQLLSLAYTNNGSATVASAAYQYNVTGTRSSEAREDGNTRNFGYDAVDRVLSSINSTLPAARNEAFAYDPEGNWTTDARVHDAADELTQDANYDYSYDAEGNLAQKTNRTNPADQTNYTYDAQNRLVQVVSPLGTSVYAYAALGRRIARTVNGTTTRYILDEQNVRLELDGSNALSAANTHAALDRLLVRDQGGAPMFFQGDALGNTTALTDAPGAVLERYRYSAFGKLEVLNPDFTAKAGNIPSQHFTFTGREWEPEAGLYFNRARFYDPDSGRWLSRDPIRENGGINLYGYVGNDPVNKSDPFGLDFTNLTSRPVFVLRHGEWILVRPNQTLTGDTDAFSVGVDPWTGDHVAFKWVDPYDVTLRERPLADGGTRLDPELTWVGTKNIERDNIDVADRDTVARWRILSALAQFLRGGYVDETKTFGSNPPPLPKNDAEHK
jgi:RHS repeat-associated protein